MNISGARLKHELATNARVIGLNGKLTVEFCAGDMEGWIVEGKITMPDIPNNAQLNKVNVREMRGLADHESFHSQFTDLGLWQKAAEYCEAWEDSESMSILNGAEDVRIERLGIKKYAGTKRNIQATVDKVLDMQADSANKATARSALPCAITWQGRSDNGMLVNLPIGLQDVSNDVANKFGDLSSVYQSDDFEGLFADCAQFLNDVLGNPTLLNFINGVKAPNKKKNVKQQSQVAKSGKSRRGQPDKEMNAGLQQAADSIVSNTVHPYYSDKDRVKYVQVETIKRSPFDWFDTERLGNGFAIALRDHKQTRMDATSQQHYLDNKRLVDAYLGKEMVWRKRKSSERGMNTAVSFLIDQSSSMYFDMKFVLSMTASLAKAVRCVGVPFEITGFTELMAGQTNSVRFTRCQELRIYQYKNFDEPVHFGRLAGGDSVQMGYTPDTEALELAVERISKRPENRKVVVILTDGHSQAAIGSEVNVNNKCISKRKIFAAHKRAILDQAKADGVEVYAIALGSGLKLQGYNSDNVVYVPDTEALVTMVFRLFYNAIAGGAL